MQVGLFSLLADVSGRISRGEREFNLFPSQFTFLLGETVTPVASCFSEFVEGLDKVQVVLIVAGTVKL